METVIITQAEYNWLKRDSEFLNALRVVGVDNWEGYYEAAKILGGEGE